jgi:antitoxin CptB
MNCIYLLEEDFMEDHKTRLKRLRMRSWHRGIKEMDLILGGFADDEMSKLSLEELNEHELMMSENDHDLYNWVSGKSEIPPELLSAIKRITSYFLKNKK